MSIVSSELVIRYSAVRTDTSANGGRMSKNAVADNAKNAFFPDWTAAQLAAGASRYRKFFLHVANDDDLTLADAALHLVAPLLGDDWVTLFAGTATDTQADIGTPDLYGAGELQSSVSAGATSFGVVLEDDALEIFRDGDTVFLATLSSAALDAGGHRTITQSEYHEGVTVSQSGSVVTVTLAEGDMLTNGYASGDAVASVLPLGDIVAAIGTVTKVTTAGTLDSTAITADHIGSITQTVTLTFTSATAFAAVSDVKGSLGTGSVSSTFAPSNTDFAKPYLTIPASAWGGTWAAGQTVSIPVTQAALGFWLANTAPAGAASYGADLVDLMMRGAS